MHIPYGRGLTPEAQQYSRANYEAPRRRKASPARKVLYVILGLIVLFALSLGISGALMASRIDGLRSHASTLQSELLTGDPNQAQVAAAALADDMRSINGQARMPQWALAEFLPFIGNDFRAVRTTLDAADQLCSKVLLPVTQDIANAGTGPMLLDGSRINAATVQTALGTLGTNATEIAQWSEQIHSVGGARIAQVESLRKKARGAFAGLDTLASASPTLSIYIPWLLGADGAPRNFLFVALSNAEVRSIGGLPGSYGILTVDNGAMSVHDFLALKDTPRYVPTDQEMEDTWTIAPGLTDEEYQLFGRRVVNVPAETAVNPHFPRFAESFSWLRTFRGHGETEGVIAIDPLFLQDLLSITGEVVTSDGTVVDGTNAARLLMSDVYQTKMPEEQDAFFADVASQCFNALLGSINAESAVDLLETIWHASGSRRLQAWFPYEEIEWSIDRLGYSGAIAQDPTHPALGVYISDDTWSKISWYLSIDTRIGKAVSNADGTTSYPVTTTVTNNLTPAEADALSDYVTGSNWRKRSRADMLDWVFFYAPAGGTITDMSADAYFTPLGRTRYGFNGMLATESMNQAVHMGHGVWYGAIQIDAGQQATFTYTVTTSPDAATPLGLDQTPTAQAAAGW